MAVEKRAIQIGRVLIVEDDPVVARIMEATLEKNQYACRVTSTVDAALQAFEEDSVPVVIVDLHLPEGNGQDLIEKLNDHPSKPIILVHTVEKDAQQVVDTMKLGVYDYLIKPVNESDLQYRLEKAFEVYELRKMQRDLEKEREVRIRKQLSWNLWKETLIFRNADRFDQTLFSNLHTIVSQGKGFGMLVSMVRDLEMLGQRKEEGLLIPASLVELLRENAESSVQAIDRFQDINRALKSKTNLTPLSVNDLYDDVQEMMDSMQTTAKINGHTLVLSAGGKEEDPRYVLLEQDLLFPAMRELLLNAMKFSRARSSILVLFKPLSETLEISVVSEPVSVDGITGIPEEMETAIFEPFFRIAKTVDERFGSMDYGLGLTYADKVVRRHGGRISAFNVMDHMDLDKGGQVRVTVQMELPLVQESKLQRVNLDDPASSVGL